MSRNFMNCYELYSKLFELHNYDTDVRQMADRRQTKASLNVSALWERRHKNGKSGTNLNNKHCYR